MNQFCATLRRLQGDKLKRKAHREVGDARNVVRSQRRAQRLRVQLSARERPCDCAESARKPRKNRACAAMTAAGSGPSPTL